MKKTNLAILLTSCLFLCFFALLIFLPLLSASSTVKQTYIIHMKHQDKPFTYATHQNLYFWLWFLFPLRLYRRILWLRCQTWPGPSRSTPPIRLSPRCLRRHPLSPPHHSHPQVPQPEHSVPRTSLSRRYYRCPRHRYLARV